jgi:hypothetical protein
MYPFDLKGVEPSVREDVCQEILRLGFEVVQNRDGSGTD